MFLYDLSHIHHFIYIQFPFSFFLDAENKELNKAYRVKSDRFFLMNVCKVDVSENEKQKS